MSQLVTPTILLNLAYRGDEGPTLIQTFVGIAGIYSRPWCKLGMSQWESW